jgi:hypothetical protein
VRKLVVLVLLLAIVLVGVEVGVRLWVDAEAEREAEANLDAVGEVDVTLRSFPVVARLLLSGEVGDMDVELVDVREEGVAVARLTARVTGLVLDRGALFGDRRVEVVDLDGARLEARVEEAAIQALLPAATIVLTPGQATVTAGDVSITAQVAIRDRALVLAVEPLPAVSIPLPSTDLLPCDPAAEIVDGAVLLACDVDDLPPALVQAIGDLSERVG